MNFSYQLVNDDGSEIDAGVARNQNKTTDIRIQRLNNNDAAHGHIDLSRITGNVWSISGNVSVADDDVLHFAGTVTLDNELTQLEFQGQGADFESGSVALFYM